MRSNITDQTPDQSDEKRKLSPKMPSTLQKTRKQISKKRNGQVNALHEKSRDTLRLHKAGVRDQRLEKLAAARSKREQPIGMQPGNETNLLLGHI